MHHLPQLAEGQPIPFAGLLVMEEARVVQLKGCGCAAGEDGVLSEGWSVGLQVPAVRAVQTEDWVLQVALELREDPLET